MNAADPAARFLAVANAEALRDAACRRILDAAASAIAQRGEFLIVLAGGRTPLEVYRRLVDANTEWARWTIFFGDERCLPRDDPDRNSRMAIEAWLAHVPVPHDRIHPIPAELGAQAAAASYAGILAGVGDFDLVLLGLGEDGHTASLFPAHDWGASPDAPDALAVFDAPKPPAERVSLSANRLGRARDVLYLVDGESKREALVRWRAGERVAAAAVRPAHGVDVLVSAFLLAEY
jgi:6-phosphogluconolactonase